MSYPSVSTHSNIELIEFIRAYLAGFGVESRLTFDPAKRKANLFATIGRGLGGVVLSGHTDVVPVAGQAWQGDPFTVREWGGRLYGRGTADMKGFIAATLAAVPAMLDCELREPIHFAFTYDEEVGCHGARRMLTDLDKSGIRPRIVIVGEPTSMEVVTSHKGVAGYRITVRGVGGHSSRPDKGVNAITWLAKVAAFIEELGAAAARRARSSSELVPPFSTFNIGTVQGGAAINMIAETAELTCDIRMVPWDRESEVIGALRERIDTQLRPAIKALDAQADISATELFTIPPLTGASNDATALAHTLTATRGSRCVSFGTEAGLFEQAGIAAVVCGPGSIEQAHQPDEYVELEQLARADRLIERLLGELRSART